MEPLVYNMEVLRGNSLEFVIVCVNLELFFCHNFFCVYQHWIFFSCFIEQPLSWGICLLFFFCLVLLV